MSVTCVNGQVLYIFNALIWRSNETIAPFLLFLCGATLRARLIMYMWKAILYKTIEKQLMHTLNAYDNNHSHISIHVVSHYS